MESNSCLRRAAIRKPMPEREQDVKAKAIFWKSAVGRVVYERTQNDDAYYKGKQNGGNRY